MISTSDWKLMFRKTSTSNNSKWEHTLKDFGSKRPSTDRERKPDEMENPYLPSPKLNVISLHNILTKTKNKPPIHYAYNSPLSKRETSLVNKSKKVNTVL